MADTLHYSDVFTINTDMSNRFPGVNSVPKLANKVHDIVRNGFQKPGLITAQEIVNDGARILTEMLLDEYYCVTHKLDYDPILVGFKKAEWELATRNVTVSKYGKYVGMHLLHKESNQNVLFVSTHQPKRQKFWIDVAENYITGYIDDTLDRTDIDFVLLAGDFNKSPAVLEELFPDFQLAVTGTSPVTTRGNNRYDNVLCSQPAGIFDVERDTSYPFSHHPMSACFYFETN